MTHDYSLEDEKDRIVMSQTKEYFEEVYTSYHLGNYRSSLVMLWSVIICDIIYKLKDLESLYNEPNAKIILAEFNKRYADKSKSSEWELRLVEDVFEKTLMIDFGTMETIRHIQQYRHISAHPVLETDYKLYIPNKDLCRGLILAALTGLLTKPSFLTKKIFDDFLIDISQNKEVLISQDQISIYLNAKYVKFLTKPTQLMFIKSLWKIVFKLDDRECKDNRNINRRVLEVLTLNHIEGLIDDIRKDQQYYSVNLSIDTKSKASSIYYYLNKFPNIYKCLREDAQIVISGVKNTYAHTVLTARFLFDNWDLFETDLLKFFDDTDKIELFDSILENDLNRIIDFYRENKVSHIIYKVFSKVYGKANNFNDADIKFSKYIDPYISDMDLSVLIFLMQASENNSQTYNRGRAKSDHKKIIDKVKKIQSAFSFSDYPEFNELAK